jgi:hypothetical protein
VERAYLEVYGRPPTERERSTAEAYVSSLAGTSDDEAKQVLARRSALAELFQALFASADFLYRG